MGSAGRQPTGVWYYVITVLSGGVLACVPFLHAGSRLDDSRLKKYGAAYAVAGAVAAGLYSLSPDDSDVASGPLDEISSALALVLVIVACVHIAVLDLKPRVYGTAQPPLLPPPPPSSPNESAVQAVEDARRKRAEARALAERDPMMARELRIGRPDLPGAYDDGGLLDLNAVSAETIASVLQIPTEIAESIVATRTRLGRFNTVYDVITFSPLDPDQIDPTTDRLIQERGIVLPPG